MRKFTYPRTFVCLMVAIMGSIPTLFLVKSGEIGMAIVCLLCTIVFEFIQAVGCIEILINEIREIKNML